MSPEPAHAAQGVTSSGEHAKLEPVPCPHCTETHPATYSHCPRTGRPLQTGPALVGRVIAGRYKVTGILGEGGMGAVYIAEHLLLGRKVAIKRLHPELTGDAKAVARFQREARAAAATGHEHIVEVLDLGYAEDGAPYLVMEYLRGSSLSQVLKQEGRLAVPRTANVIGQVLAALAAVHQQQIVHRDLKPDNVFLTRRGGIADYVKVLDFGISKMKQEDGEPTDLTRTGVTMGTPYYMSPEQARGMRQLDHRVDLYAVSVMMYECLTGRLPLHGDNYHALLQKILRVEPAPPSSIVPGLPPALDALLLRGLAKDPAQRFATATEMLEALVPFGARSGESSAMQATEPVSTPNSQTRLPAIAERVRPEPGRVDARGPTESAGPPQPAAPPSPGPRDSDARRAGGGWPSERAAGDGSTLDRPASGATARPTSTSLESSWPGAARPAARRSATATKASGSERRPLIDTGPRYFYAASDDWAAGPERRGDRHTTSERSGETFATEPRPGTPGVSDPGRADTGRADTGRADTGRADMGRADMGRADMGRADMGKPDPTRSDPSKSEPAKVEPAKADASRGVRESLPARQPREEVAVKGALVLGLVDHFEHELGAEGADALVSRLEPTLRTKLEGMILPMAWLPFALFDAMLVASERLDDGTRPLAAGRALAERELSTTHRLFLQTASPATVLERLPHLHRVYFTRGEVKVSAAPTGARIELEGLPPESTALVAWLSGFWQRMFELAGAREVKIAASTSRGRGDDRTSVTLRWR